MKVRIETTIELHESILPSIKQLAKRYEYDSWRQFVRVFIVAEGLEGLEVTASSERNHREWEKNQIKD